MLTGSVEHRHEAEPRPWVTIACAAGVTPLLRERFDRRHSERNPATVELAPPVVVRLHRGIDEQREHWRELLAVAGYRSQSDTEFSFRQLKDRHVVSFSPMRHWTDHTIRVHLFTCVRALQLARLIGHRNLQDQHTS